jgi:hypothetical protein
MEGNSILEGDVSIYGVEQQMTSSFLEIDYMFRYEAGVPFPGVNKSLITKKLKVIVKVI